MRIIIAGGGEIGYALSKELSREHEIFVVDHNPDVRERFESLDVELLTGSATNADVLERARARRRSPSSPAPVSTKST